MTSVAAVKETADANLIARYSAGTLTINPSSYNSGSVPTRLENRIYTFEIQVSIWDWDFSYELNIYLEPATFTTGCGTVKMYPTTYGNADADNASNIYLTDSDVNSEHYQVICGKTTGSGTYYSSAVNFLQAIEPSSRTMWA